MVSKAVVNFNQINNASKKHIAIIQISDYYQYMGIWVLLHSVEDNS